MQKRVCILLCAFALSGCHFGRFSLSMNRDHMIPTPEVSVLPEQWEPEIVDP